MDIKVILILVGAFLLFRWFTAPAGGRPSSGGSKTFLGMLLIGLAVALFFITPGFVLDDLIAFILGMFTILAK